ncbi:hypothetical protein VB620_10370 [Nodularia harveyana UHCC-0300]|uniref:Uncharacterized protein n=1 Tax=Nodularia harveyana UHCC-0300 TaxID=2974287 RepID=A0ABU5UDY5_9CYAN|nr:hypothetical protein [Nodularia harveyana]MEA5581741.1 hypothetical protein [Nodularia harveyana UHCC-0300]
MYKNKPNVEEVLAYPQAEIEDYDQKIYAEIERYDELLFTMKTELVERRELGTDEEYSQPIDVGIEAK